MEDKKKFIIDEPLCKIGYHHFTTYTVSDVSSIPSSEDGNLHLYWEDYVGHKWFIEDSNKRKCIFHLDGCTPFKHNAYAYSALVFKNNGTVELSGAGDARLCNITFDNDGDAIITYDKRPTKTGKSVVNGRRKVGNYGFRLKFKTTKFNINNRGDFIIKEEDPAKVYIERKCRLDVRNKGNVIIDRINKLYNAEFYNKGNVSISVVIATDNVKFNNRGKVDIELKCLRNSSFKNRGDVYISFLKGSRISSRNRFDNLGNVTFFGEMPSFYNMSTKFKNYGNVNFNIGDNAETTEICSCDNYSTLKIEKNVGTVNFNGVTAIYCYRAIFNNKSSVNGKNIKTLVGSFEFNNGYDVRLPNLLSCASTESKLNRVLRFKNYGDLYLNSFDNEKSEDYMFPTIKNKGMCVFRSNYPISSEWRRKRSMNKNFPVYSKNGDMEYSNSSYLKRYNIEIKDGVATLYKAIGKKSKKSPYDKIDTKWEIGSIVEHPNWDPYKNEIGEGKYIAGFSPDIFNGLYRGKPYDVIKIEVNLSDLYEWPVIYAKKPQFIGFRRAYVVEKI